MSEYEMGRDIQELRSRIERFEGVLPWIANGGEENHRSEWTGSVSGELKAGIDPDAKPMMWALDKGLQLPPFLAPLFGLEPMTLHDLAPESKTWTLAIEPWITFVTWDTGGTEEHFRFSNQVFSVIRYTDPNTGRSTATAMYSARLTQRAGRSIDWAGGNPNPPPYVPAYYAGPSFHVTLQNAGGAGLFNYYQRFSVTCGANRVVTFSSDFPPGLYDLVTGANFHMGSWRIARC